MAFNWKKFLEAYRIEHIEEGPNVKRGNVNIACPLCGNDPSHHMGLNLEDASWGCWRNSQHRGKNPVRLIAALAKCSFADAEKMVKEGTPEAAVGLDKLKQLAQGLGQKKEKKVRKYDPVKYPKSFHKVNTAYFGRRFRRYLMTRGFRREELVKLCRHYQLRYCLVGQFKHRVIFPFLREGEMIGWTGRAIAKAENRYLSYPSSEVVKHLLFNSHYAETAQFKRVLVVVEGPLDCIKLDFYLQEYGIHVVGLLGVSTTVQQIAELLRIGEAYDMVVFMLDEEALARSLDLQSAASKLNAKIQTDCMGFDDPGDMREKHVRKLAKKFLKWWRNLEN